MVHAASAAASATASASASAAASAAASDAAQFINIYNRGVRRSSAGDIWQISGNPVEAATGGRRRVSLETLGTISTIRRLSAGELSSSAPIQESRARPSSPFWRQLRGLNFQLEYTLIVNIS